MPAIYILNPILPFVAIISIVEYIHLAERKKMPAANTTGYDYYALAIGSFIIFLLTIYSVRTIIVNLYNIGFIICPLCDVILGLILGYLNGKLIFGALQSKTNVRFAINVAIVTGIIYATCRLQYLLPMMLAHILKD